MRAYTECGKAVVGTAPTARKFHGRSKWPRSPGTYVNDHVSVVRLPKMRAMSSAVTQTVPLSTQWPTLDPFLFCAHHRDNYPKADGALAPAPGTAGRTLGQDFSGLDGWSMYHGTTVPGFPQHPHRGFETLTYVRSGWCDHADSLGAKARFGQGDAQWLTAGSGIVHSEMFPLIDEHARNPLHLFQIWINLPASKKMVDPHYSMLWAEDLPRPAAQPGVAATVIAGSLFDETAPAAPPHSWAGDEQNQVAVWHLDMQADSQCSLPAVSGDISRVLYLFEGQNLAIGDRVIDGGTGAVLAPDMSIDISATGPVEFLVLQGRPIGEPVAQHGPFVMNTASEIDAAFADYQRTQFGGWPWPTDDPVHGAGVRRFADYVDGRNEQRSVSTPHLTNNLGA